MGSLAKSLSRAFSYHSEVTVHSHELTPAQHALMSRLRSELGAEVDAKLRVVEEGLTDLASHCMLRGGSLLGVVPCLPP
jgi:hypothetical protein